MGKPRDLANVVATGNILADGAVAPAELTGVTSTAAEINILDGVTATAAELNLLDGVTATTAELNHVDGVTSNVQTQMDTKAPVASPTFTGTATAPTVNASTALQIGGVAVTATAAELNKMDGVTVSASDINTVTAKAPTASPSFTGNATITVTDNSDALTLISTDADANVGPVLNLYRNSASPADNDVLGRVLFKGEDDAGNEATFARIEAIATDVSNGSEDGRIDFITAKDDAFNVALSVVGDKIGIGTTVPSMTLDVDGSSGGNDIVRFSGPNSGGLTFRNATSNEFILHTATSDALIFGTAGNNERMRIDANGDASFTEELIAKSYNETYVSLSAGSTVDINNETGNVFALTTNQNTTLTFSNPPASGTSYGFTLKLTAGGSHTITYPNSVDFAGGTAPDAPASGETDVLVFFTVDGGTNWYGAIAIDAAG